MASTTTVIAATDTVEVADNKAGTKPKKSKEPKYTRLTQQELGACKPVLEPLWVLFIFFAVGVVMIPIGAICLSFGLKPVEVKVRYDQTCIPLALAGTNEAREQYIWANINDTTALSCTLTMNIKKRMAAPVYVYYELDGFYQNHRRYVKSRSDLQLVNDSSASTGSCSPQEYFAGDKSKLINPCGLIAWSLFNDSYAMSLTRETNSSVLPISSKGIAFASDVNHRYKNYLPENFNPYLNGSRGGGQINGTVGQDERFITWMRLAALPNFRKLWGKIEYDLLPGDTVTVQVLNQYNTYGFDGKKSIVLATTTWLGSRNPFLGIAYLVTGGLSVLMAIIYWILYKSVNRKFGDISAKTITYP